MPHTRWQAWSGHDSTKCYSEHMVRELVQGGKVKEKEMWNRIWAGERGSSEEVRVVRNRLM